MYTEKPELLTKAFFLLDFELVILVSKKFYEWIPSLNYAKSWLNIRFYVTWQLCPNVGVSMLQHKFPVLYYHPEQSNTYVHLVRGSVHH